MSDTDESKTTAALVGEVVKLTKEVAVLAAQFPSHVDWVVRNVKDHEDRIRVLEIGAARSAWVPVLVTAVVTAIIVGLAVGYITNVQGGKP